MSDFLVSLNKQYKGEDLLELIQKSYGEYPSKGTFFEYPWGCIAVLEERLAGNKNIFTKDDTNFAWVGDLATDLQNDFIERFIHRLTELRRCPKANGACLQSDELFGQLNGAFAMIAANPEGFCIVTDPLSFIPVYVGTNDTNVPVSFGTHPDIVAAISGDCLKLDVASAGEFLDSGYCTFPNTMHTNVKEMAAGRVHVAKRTESGRLTLNDFVYWLPPKEIRDGYDKLELAEELEGILRSAVELRCSTKKVAVLLSGGLDSRAIIASVPKSTECIALTFSNAPNRETRAARKIAKCYGRPWHLLIRDPEVLANNIVDIVKFVGCELQWVDAHNLMLSDKISKYGTDPLLSGLLFDRFLKGSPAVDMVMQERLHGYLPPKYSRAEINYADNMADFWKKQLKKDVVEEVYNRRNRRYNANMDRNRSSIEWLHIYPFSQLLGNAYWVADRRVLPLRLIATDRNILDFAFKCPVELKLNDAILLAAALGIYGKGARIIDANDGCRPGSGSCRRFIETAIQKTWLKSEYFLQRLGKKPKVQDSWHDYPRYWNSSVALANMKRQYSVYLDEFKDVLFEELGGELLFIENICWIDGFRLLQLAIWRCLMEQYQRK